jgi:hypothetical protein
MPQDFSITDDVATINQCYRAIVYLTVDWSIPERESRKIFNEAIAPLLSRFKVMAFRVSEDSAVIMEWLASLDWAHAPMGAGSVLWLENGRCVDSVIFPSRIGVRGILEKTNSLWDRPET